MPGASFKSAVLIGVPALAALGGLATLRLQPPERGDMLLVPLGAQSRGDLATFAQDRGLRLLAAGDWPGSILVRGERDRLGSPLRDAGVLVIAAAIKGCSPA